MPRKQPEPPPVQPRIFESAEEIDRGIAKLERRIVELENLDVGSAISGHTGADDVARSNACETIRDIFGTNSPEFRENEHLQLWAGPLFINMATAQIIAGTDRGRIQAIGILRGLINRLKEKREDFTTGGITSPASYFDQLSLHPRIAGVSRDLFQDGYHWEAVFAVSKALVNYVKEQSGRHDLDRAPLMRAVFSKNSPVLALNDLKDQTDFDEQEGMMHLFEGAVLGIRNPGGHTFPEGPEQRAIEYISLLSLLAYRIQEAKRKKST
ncbi:MAG: hypothetical protein QOD12_1640 [Verrucomicrobiota bacterium]|jgi:uncharacterized protein (TIGR02391 family)